MNNISNSTPSFPSRALRSRPIFYQQLQDLDIYVEDQGSEQFYLELLRRLIGTDTKIVQVFPLGGRENVINESQNYTDTRPALFLIDGDLHLACGLPAPTSPYLFRHPCYCVENYLFCENGMVQIIVENHGSISEEEAKANLDWQSYKSYVQELLAPLFIEFAIAFSLYPSLPTISHGIGSVIDASVKGQLPRLCENKINTLIDNIRNDVISKAGQSAYDSERLSIENRFSQHLDPVTFISGKTFLIPLQMFKASEIGRQKLIRDSFLFRLARHFNTNNASDLRQRIIACLSPPASPITGA